MNAYYVVDEYEGFEVVGSTNDMKEAFEILNQRIEDTDGECVVGIIETNNSHSREYLEENGVVLD